MLSLAVSMQIVCFADTREESGVEIIEASEENAVECSNGLKWGSIDPILNDDHTMALICDKEKENSGYAVFKAKEPFRAFAVETYMNTWARVNLKFYVSKDGKDWKFADIQLFAMNKTKHNDVWEATQQLHRAYEGGHLDDDYTYLKLEYPDFDYICNIVSIHFSKDEAYKLGTTSRVAHSQKPDFDYSTIKPLKEVFKDYFKVGCSVEPWDLDQYSELLDTQFDVITTENQFKGHIFQQGADQWYFTGADTIVNWAQEHGKQARGHALWYHGNMYNGFFKDSKGAQVDKEEALKRMEKHVKTKVSRYKGKMQYYDVLNEIFDPGSGTLKGYMEEAQICGQDYIPYVFKWAKEVDPDAILLYNDNGHLIPAQRNGIISQIKKWLDEGVPIDAIGLQWHESVFSSEEDMRDLFEKLRDLGLPVIVTEMDITAYRSYDYTTSYKWEDREKVRDAVARAYATTFDVFREYSDIIDTVSFWCPTDNRSSETRGNRYNYPLLFDMNGEPSLNYWAVIDEEKTMPRMTEDVWKWKELEKNYPDGYEPMISAVYKGTPIIDGEIDDVWDIAEEFPVKKFCVGKSGATGTVKVLWDDDSLYVLGKVTDETPDISADDAWNRDNMEIFVSQSNMHVNWLGGGDVQYRIDPTGLKQSFTEAVCVPTEDGYLYEAKMDMNVVKPQPGTIYSFEAGFADACDGVVNSISKWCDVTNMSYQKTDLWGDIVISDGTTPIPDKGTGTDSESENKKPNASYAKAAFTFKDSAKSAFVIMRDGSAMISMKDFAELTNVRMKSEKGGIITFDDGEHTLKLTLDSTLASADGEELRLTAAPNVTDGKTLLPLRFVFESLGYTVDWNGDTQSISVN